MTLRGTAWMMGALLATLSVAACNREPSPPIQEGAVTTQPLDSRSDAELATAVQGRFYADDLVRRGRIDVDVNDGGITLAGTAPDEQTKARALDLARNVDGVREVHDQVRIADSETAQASARPDDQASAQQQASGSAGESGPQASRTIEGNVTPNPTWITTQIQARYFASREVKPSNVDVTARSGGIVELRGDVESVQARNEAVRIASEVDGVMRVDDLLRVRNADAGTRTATDADAGAVDTARNELSDAWVTAKVQSKFYLDNDIRGRDIDVDTDGAIVTLTGNVRSPQERRQAVAIARNTDGVRDVQDQLQVVATSGAAETDARPQGTSGRAVGDVVEDGWITTKIQSQYFLDRTVKGHEINVDTRNGVVTLNGSVDTETQKQAAEQIARETDGVAKVSNQLRIGG